jgi:hypothetical protein
MIPAPSGSHLRCLKCVKTYGKHFIDPKSSEFCPFDPKSSEFCPFFKFFLVRRKLPFFCQNCSLPCLPFSLRSLDNPFEILEETLISDCPLSALVGPDQHSEKKPRPSLKCIKLKYKIICSNLVESHHSSK